MPRLSDVRVAAVIDDDVQPIGKALREHRLDAAAQQQRTILRARDDGHARAPPGVRVRGYGGHTVAEY